MNYRRSGFSIAQVLVATGLIAGLSMVVTSIIGAIGRSNQQASLIRTAGDLSTNLRALVNSSLAWSKTVDMQKTGALACVANHTDCASAGGVIKIYGIDGRLEFDDAPTAGFSQAGLACNTYAATGNDPCPFKMSVEWQPICPPSGACTSPQIRILGTLAFTPRTKTMPLNVGRFALNLIQGQGSGSSANLEDFCKGMGGEWNADTEACDIQKIACEAAGGQWTTDAGGSSKCVMLGGENEFACTSDEAMQGIDIVDGVPEPICVSLSDDFNPDDPSVQLASKNWNHSALKTVPQDKVLGCATGTKGSDSEVASSCAQDRPPGTAGTCYYRTPLKNNGTPDTGKAGWYRVSGGSGAYCKAGIYLPTGYPDP